MNAEVLNANHPFRCLKATTALYYYTRYRSGETTLYTNPYSFHGIYTKNVSNYRRGNGGCEKLQTNKVISANFRFSAQYFRKRIFFQNILGGAIVPLAPPLATALSEITVIEQSTSVSLLKCFVVKMNNNFPFVNEQAHTSFINSKKTYSCSKTW